MSRAEDRSFWMRSAYYAEKYKILIWIVSLVLIALGFRFKTPGMIVDELQAQITLNKRFVDSTVMPRVDRLDNKIDVLLRLRCVDKSLTVQERLLTGLNAYCNGLQSER